MHRTHTAPRRTRTARIALAAAVSAALLGVTAGETHAAQSTATNDGAYVPFVTDFPEPAHSPEHAPETSASGFDLGDVSVEGRIAAVVALLAAAGLAVARRAAR